MELFGFEFKKKKAQQEQEVNLSNQFATPENKDGAVEFIDGGAAGLVRTSLALDPRFDEQSKVITQYRKMATVFDVENAVDDIVNEAITIDDDNKPLNVVLDDTDFSDNIKTRIIEEFDVVLKLMDFNSTGYDIFRDFYVDGKLNYHMVVDKNNPKRGIQKLVKIDPRLIKLVREIIYKQDGEARIPSGKREYYMYDESILSTTYKNNMGIYNSQSFEIHKDSIAEATSGIVDTDTGIIRSHLHKAIKPLNQLSVVEDSLVIYRLSRAPERRAFYIDVGSLPRGKVNEYINKIRNKFKSKITYNSTDGTVEDSSDTMTMLEDFWLPRREGGQGTQIETLGGADNLGQIDDIVYFQKRLYKALNVPVSRMDTEATVNFGRNSEITRDELKFNKFVVRLRNRFNTIFKNILKTQLVLKGVLTLDEWNEEEQNIRFDYVKDYYLVESKELELMEGRMAILRDIHEYEGKYFSRETIQRKILRMSEEEIKDEQKRMDEERQAGLYGNEDDGF